MKSNEVGHVQALSRSDDCECDERGCGASATIRLTVPSQTAPKGISFKDFCRDCYKDFQHEHSKQHTA